MKRSLIIEFEQNGDVKYTFNRDPGFKEYTIEYPADQVEIQNENELDNWNYQKSITDQGYLKLISQVTEKGRTSIRYTKRKYLSAIQDCPPLYKYNEIFKIKNEKQSSFPVSSFLFTLHGRNRRISAIKSRSNATFLATSDGSIHTCQAFYRHTHGGMMWHYDCAHHEVQYGTKTNLEPTELDNCVFCCQGILTIDWVLEIDESYER
jgi:hypothetical protein